jgi:hypothetical protein
MHPTKERILPFGNLSRADRAPAPTTKGVPALSKPDRGYSSPATTMGLSRPLEPRPRAFVPFGYQTKVSALETIKDALALEARVSSVLNPCKSTMSASALAIGAPMAW